MRKIILLTFFSVFSTLSYGQCPDPPSVDADQYFCSETAWLLIGESADNLGDLQIFPDQPGWTLTWYEDNAGVPGTVIANPDTELLVNGTVYHVTQTDNSNCESDPLAITVNESDCACIKDPTFEDQNGNARARGYEFVQFDGISNHKTCGQSMQGATPLAIGTTNGVGANDDAVFVTPGNDPPYVNTGGAPIGTLPLVRTNPNNPSSTHGFRLNKGHEYQTVITAMQKDFIAGEVFVFNFALAVQNPNHAYHQQPFAQIRLYDQNDNVVQQRCLVSDTNDCIFSSQGTGFSQVLYSDWSCMKLNTFEYQGQPLKAEITVAYCTPTQHFSYIYVDDIYVGNDNENICGNSSFGYALVEEVIPAGQNCFITEQSDEFVGCGTGGSLTNIPGFPLEVCGIYDAPISQGAPPTLDDITLNIIQNDNIVGTVTGPAAGNDPNSFCFTIDETDINVLPYGEFTFELEVDFTLDCGDPYNFYVDDKTTVTLCPRASCPMPLTVCDTGDTGFSNFDLTEAEADILGNNWQVGDIIFTYFETEEDAHNNTNEIVDPTNYDNTVAGGQTIYIRLDWNISQMTDACYYLVTLDLAINKLPVLDLLDEYVGCGTNFEVTLSGTPTNLSELDEVSYRWYRNGNQIPTTGSFYDANEPGEYTVIVSNFDCEVSHTFTVRHVDFSVNLGDDVVVCDASDHTIVPNIIEGPSQDPIDPNEIDYLWNTGETTPAITVSQSGVYSVEVTYDGCTITQQINVAIGDLEIDLGDTINQCDLSQGYELIVTINGVPENEVTYLWSTGETSTTIIVYDFGLYSVDVDWNGCVETASVEIVQPEAPEFTLGDNITKCAGDIVTLQIQFIDTVEGDLSYTWYRDGGQLSETGDSIDVTDFGEYTAIVNNEGCTSEASIMVEPYESNPECIITQGISPEGSPGSNDYFDLGFLAARTGIDNLQIFNRHGVLVYELNNYTNQWEGQTTDGDSLPTGVYFYVINLSGNDPVYGSQTMGNVYLNRGMN